MTDHKVLHSGYCSDTLRRWQSRDSRIDPDCLIYPLFISCNEDCLEEITTLPEQHRVGVKQLKTYLSPYVEIGLKTVLLFGVMESDLKKEMADNIVTNKNPVLGAITLLRKEFPNLTIACDLCLCGYTTHGHCGILSPDGVIDNQSTLDIFAKAALKYVEYGAHIIAPSDMMDGRIKAISDCLKIHQLRNRVTIMSYSAKFASCFYGPFRGACSSAPAFGDRKNYQLPPGSSGLAKRAVLRDVDEEADIVMVKPGMPYLDIVRQTKDLCPEYPVAVYQVSGEYVMLLSAAANGAFNKKEAVLESLQCMHRAGADIIISYFTPDVLGWINNPEEITQW